MTVFWITAQVVTTLCDYRAVFQIMLALSCTLITTYNSPNLQVSLAEREFGALEQYILIIFQIASCLLTQCSRSMAEDHMLKKWLKLEISRCLQSNGTTTDQ